MPDEQEPRRDPRMDDTRQYSDDEDADSPGGPGDQPPDPAPTQIGGIHPEDGPRSGDAEPIDRTRQMPSVPGEDATAVAPQAPPRDSTAVMPPVRDWAAQDRAWAGRAEVRPPRPGDYGTATADWDAVPPPDEPRGKWWMPILVGILALVMLALLGWGIYMIAQNTSSGGETPAPAPSPSVPEPTQPATTPPRTEPTTTEPTTTTPTTQLTETEVTVPALIGLSQPEAQQALERRGLSYRLIFRPNDAPPGTVIDSDPAEGQEVPPDSQVTLVVATGPS